MHAKLGRWAIVLTRYYAAPRRRWTRLSLSLARLLGSPPAWWNWTPLGYPLASVATQSISTSAPFGSFETSTVARAGGSLLKNAP